MTCFLIELPNCRLFRKNDSTEPAWAQLCLDVHTGVDVCIFIPSVLRIPHYKKPSKESMNIEVISQTRNSSLLITFQNEPIFKTRNHI